MIALVDGDIIVYRIGFTTNDEPDWIAKSRADFLINSIMEDVGGDSLRLYLSDALVNNYRYHLADSYKANRRDQPKPEHYDLLKEHLIVEWDAKIAHEQEADDALGIEQISCIRRYNEFLNWEWESLPEGEWHSVICSIDKDLLQIPGNHYNFVTKEKKYVTILEGTRWFYQQVLMGDITENVKGIPGVGSQKSAKILEGLNTEEEMFRATYKAYQKAFKERAEEELLLVGRLLKIRQQEEEIWHFPLDVKQLRDIRSSYLASTAVATIPG